MSRFTITPAFTPQDLADTFALLEEYAASLGIDLAFQDIATEKATWPGKYAAAAGGALLIARRINTDDKDERPGEAIGCVGLRSLGSEWCCEMKRLYVRPSGRGLGVGRALAEAIIEEAKILGSYRAMRLDTLPATDAARALYEGLGFQEISAYYDTVVRNTVFLGLDLAGE